MSKLSRRLVFLDFCCAFAGALVYFFLFNLMIGSIGLPTWLAHTQMYANFVYGIYGLFLFAINPKQSVFFRFLFTMNFLYATGLAMFAVLLSTDGKLAGAGILLVESMLIAGLALAERKSLPKT